MPLTDGLLAYYRLDGGGTDSSGNGRDLAGALGFGTGSGPCGSGGWLNAGVASSAVFGSPVASAAWSLSGWYFPTGTFSATAGNLSLIQSGINAVRIQLLRSTLVPSAVLNNGAHAVAGPAVELDAWSHVALVVAGGSAELFVNGVSAGTTACDASYTVEQVASVAGSGGRVRCGHEGAWPRALSGAEVLALYNGGAGLDPTAAPATGGAVCGTFATTPTVAGTFATAPVVSGTFATTPTVAGTFDVEAC
jgi:hypothetical protein